MHQNFRFIHFILLVILFTACGGKAPIQAPAGLVATPFEGRIVLTWQDKSSDETGFSIYRAEVAHVAAHFSPQQNEHFEEIGAVTANVEKYEDRTAMLGTLYRYGVKAEAKRGASSMTVNGEGPVELTNRVPTATAQKLSTSENTPLDISLSGSDPDGGPLTYSVTKQPTYGNLSGKAPKLSYVPDDGYVGIDSFEFKVSDGISTSETATVTIEVIEMSEAAPAVTLNDPGELTEGKTVILNGTYGGGTTKIEIFEDAIELGEAKLSSGVWSYSYTPTIAGAYTLKAVASNAVGEPVEARRSVTVFTQWPVQFGSIFDDRAYSAATDANGNVYISGETLGNISADNPSNHDVFIAKYGPKGEQVWVKQFDGGAEGTAYGITTYANSHIYIVGHIGSGIYDPGLISPQTHKGGSMFVAKYDVDGNQVWLESLPTHLYNTARSVTTDANGDVYVAGYTNQGVSDSGHVGGSDIFVAKYDADGNQVWIKQFGTNEDDEAHGIVTDADGNIYVGGHVGGNLTPSGSGGDDMVIAKYDNEGNQIWVRQFGSHSDESARSITVGPSGNIYMVGETLYNLSGSNAGKNDVYIIKYDADGNQLWVKQFGGSNHDYAHKITVGDDDYLYIAGFTEGVLAEASTGGTDIFAAKYGTDGAQVWIKQFGTSADDKAYGIANAAGDILITGETQGEFSRNHIGGYDVFIARLDGTQEQ